MPKCLLRFHRRSSLEFCFAKMRSAALRRCIVIGHHLFGQVQRACHSLDHRGVWVACVREKVPSGTGGCLRTLFGYPADHYLVLFGDVFFATSLRRLVARHLITRADITLGAAFEDAVIPYGVIESRRHRVRRFIEKPRSRVPVFAGVAVIAAGMLRRCSREGCYGFDEVIERALRARARVIEVPLQQWHHLCAADFPRRHDGR